MRSVCVMCVCVMLFCQQTYRFQYPTRIVLNVFEILLFISVSFFLSSRISILFIHGRYNAASSISIVWRRVHTVVDSEIQARWNECDLKQLRRERQAFTVTVVSQMDTELICSPFDYSLSVGSFVIFIFIFFFYLWINIVLIQREIFDFHEFPSVPRQNHHKQQQMLCPTCFLIVLYIYFCSTRGCVSVFAIFIVLTFYSLSHTIWTIGWNASTCRSVDCYNCQRLRSQIDWINHSKRRLMFVFVARKSCLSSHPTITSTI